MKILIAEDESSSALILRRTLEKYGHTVAVARDGTEAWAALNRDVFPVAILDWMMPGIDGPTLCERIREQGRSSYIYVILLTSRNAKADRLQGLYSGADDFLEKPLGRGELMARLEIAQRILAMQEDLQRRAAEVAVLNNHLQHQNAQMQSLNAELEQFATIACHDLQEPLRKIQLFASRLVNHFSESSGSNEAVIVHSIFSTAARMKALISELFDLTQIDRTERRFVDVDLAKISQEVVKDLEIRLEETNGHVVIGDLPTVQGDPIQLRQLIQNLVSNGLKFRRPSAPPVVTISASPLQELKIIVSDNGIGFEEQYLTRMFEPFQRLHSRAEYEGTGMGLAICKKIVDRHYGTITAHSAPGQGATFEVDLSRNSKHKGYNV
jgi:light-regulated signal transduction histidine kinase (bacteriophytochrome)